MNPGALNALMDLMPTLSKAERRIAKAIVDDPESVLHMTLNELSRAARAGDATARAAAPSAAAAAARARLRVLIRIRPSLSEQRRPSGPRPVPTPLEVSERSTEGLLSDPPKSALNRDGP